MIKKKKTINWRYQIKILYIGNFLDGTGWATLGINTILALDAAGIDVAARAIKLNNNTPQVPQRILELEQRSCVNPDVVIQNVLPHLIDYNGKIAKNIAFYTSETTNFKMSSWPTHINTLDNAWVLSQQSKEASLESGVTIPISVVPCGTDVSKFNRSYEPLDIKRSLAGKYIFYTIGELNRRKNLPALVKAFHTEFSPDEPVELVIKTTPVGVGVAQSINEMCHNIKVNLKLYPNISDYKQEIVIVNYWNETDVLRLHSSCDCFVATSYGEAFMIPCFDALGMGKSVIAPAWGGFLEYLSHESSWLVPGRLEPTFGETNTFPDLFTARENWFSINPLDLQKVMRESYENKVLRTEKAKVGIRRAQDFSYEKVGQILKSILEG